MSVQEIRFRRGANMVGVTQYRNDARTSIPFDDRETFATFEDKVWDDSILGRYTAQGQNVAAGIRDLRTRIFNVQDRDRTYARNIGIVFIWQEPSQDQRLDIQTEAAAARANGIFLIAIGYSRNRVSRNTLELIAYSNAYAFLLESPEQFVGLYGNLGRWSCDLISAPVIGMKILQPPTHHRSQHHF